MLSRISSESLISISNKHNYKTFSKSPPASLIYCMGNILSHSSGKWRDSLRMAALSFTFVQYLFTNISLATVLIISSKKMIPIPFLVFHLVQAFGTVKGFFYLITNKNNCVSFKFTKFICSNEL